MKDIFCRAVRAFSARLKKPFQKFQITEKDVIDTVASGIRHLWSPWKRKRDFIFFYLAFGLMLSLIAEWPGHSEFANSVLSEQLGLKTVMLMLVSGGTLFFLTLMFSSVEQKNEAAYQRLSALLSRVVGITEDLCLIFAAVMIIPVLFDPTFRYKPDMYIACAIAWCFSILVYHVPNYLIYPELELGTKYRLAGRFGYFCGILLMVFLFLAISKTIENKKEPVSKTDQVEHSIPATTQK